MSIIYWQKNIINTYHLLKTEKIELHLGGGGGGRFKF